MNSFSGLPKVNVNIPPPPPSKALRNPRTTGEVQEMKDEIVHIGEQIRNDSKKIADMKQEHKALEAESAKKSKRAKIMAGVAIASLCTLPFLGGVNFPTIAVAATQVLSVASMGFFQFSKMKTEGKLNDLEGNKGALERKQERAQQTIDLMQKKIDKAETDIENRMQQKEKEAVEETKKMMKSAKGDNTDKAEIIQEETFVDIGGVKLHKKGKSPGKQ